VRAREASTARRTREAACERSSGRAAARGSARPERARQRKEGLFSSASSTRFPRPLACLRTPSDSTDLAWRLIAALIWPVSRGRCSHRAAVALPVQVPATAPCARAARRAQARPSRTHADLYQPRGGDRAVLPGREARVLSPCTGPCLGPRTACAPGARLRPRQRRQRRCQRAASVRRAAAPPGSTPALPGWHSPPASSQAPCERCARRPWESCVCRNGKVMRRGARRRCAARRGRWRRGVRGQRCRRRRRSSGSTSAPVRAVVSAAGMRRAWQLH
jgi:hypothetical protein